MKSGFLINFSFQGGRDSSYDQFLGDLMACGPEDCRYGLYDFEYDHQCQGTSEKTRKEKLLLMSWCPDTARIKKKMLYSSSFDALKKCLVGVQKYIQVHSTFIFNVFKVVFESRTFMLPSRLLTSRKHPPNKWRKSCVPQIASKRVFLMTHQGMVRGIIKIFAF